MNITTMDAMASGSVFHFADDGRHPGFVKIGNNTAKNLLDGRVRPNDTQDDVAAGLKVFYERRATPDELKGTGLL